MDGDDDGDEYYKNMNLLHVVFFCVYLFSLLWIAIDIGEMCLSRHMNTESTFLFALLLSPSSERHVLENEQIQEKFERYSFYFLSIRADERECVCVWLTYVYMCV